jgi:hypothetical protein
VASVGLLLNAGIVLFSTFRDIGSLNYCVTQKFERYSPKSTKGYTPLLDPSETVQHWITSVGLSYLSGEQAAE